MSGFVTEAAGKLLPGALAEFEKALGKLPDGYVEGRYEGRAWGVTVNRSADRRRIWLYGEELGATNIVSFNLYMLATARPILKPCEMSSSKVVEFVLGFDPHR